MTGKNNGNPQIISMRKAGTLGVIGGHIGLLKVNPAWNPLRDHPRFQKLLEGGR